MLDKEGRTTPPKPYTEGGLINLMKNAGRTIEDELDRDILKEVEGIGTEATRSGIIETVKRNGYIEVVKNIVSVTNKGEILCGAIEGTLLASPSLTAKWEGYLRKIGNGQATPEKFIANIQSFITDLITKAPEGVNKETLIATIAEEKTAQSLGSCPGCHTGELVDRKTFIGCIAYKSGCKFSINKKVAGKKLTDKNIKDLIEKGRTSIIKGFTSKGGKKFDAALTIKEGKVTFQFS